MSKAEAEDSPKGGKRERTRAALIQATLDVVAEKGFAAASLDEIAARAQMTKGAIYSNFSGRAELLLVAAGARGLSVPQPHAETLAEGVREIARGLVEMIRRTKEEANFAAEFSLYALSDPELREGVATFYTYNFTHSAEYLAALAGAKPGLSPRRLAVALQAIALGFMFQAFITPEEVDEDVVFLVMNALAESVAPG